MADTTVQNAASNCDSQKYVFLLKQPACLPW